MRPLTLTLTNFIGIRAGLGRETLLLDLESLAGKAALVAIIGPNGAGKSTIIDNLHPYRVMPSRSGGYSPGSFSYYDQIGMGDSSKELEWEHAGRRYRSSLLFKQTPKTKKTEAYLFAMDGIDWIPASTPDGTVSDGKADTYDRVLEHILGTPEMFFTSAFSAQGRRGLASYSNGEIKGLLSELLGLDNILDKGKLAAEAGKTAKSSLDAAREAFAGVAAKRSELSTAHADLSNTRAEITVAVSTKDAARAQVNESGKRLADIRAEASGNTEMEIRRTTLTRQITGIQDGLSKLESNLQAEIAREDIRHGAETLALSADVSALDRQINAAKQQITDSLAMQSRAAEVASASTNLPMAQAAVREADSALASSRTADAAAKELAANIRTREAELAGVGRDGKALADACDGLRHRAGLIASVPCQSMDISGACPLLKDAHDARAKTPDAEAATEAKRSAYREMSAGIIQMRASLTEMGDTASKVASAQQSLTKAQDRLRALESIAALAPAIAAAESTILAAERSIAEWSVSHRNKTKSLESIAAAHQSRLSALTRDMEVSSAGMRASLLEAQASLTALPPPADTAALTGAEQSLAGAEKALAEADQAISRLTARIGALEERVARLNADLAGADEQEKRISALEEDVAQWALLTKALGPDGIVALSIDDAGPTLAAYANDLLLACYGPRYSVGIRTQAETAKGDMKETFDIRVFDGDAGDEKSIRDMSGGQKVYINEAMTRAIALYQAEMHGRHYECLFADESDGALDQERKVQFMRMKRRVLELGGYRQEIFISHTPELWEMADAVIDVGQFITNRAE